MRRFTTFIVFLLLSNIVIAQISNNKYDYFLRNAKVADNSNSRIIINKATGDTTFQAFYNIKDIVNNTNQDFSKIYKGTPFFKNGWYKGTFNTESGKKMEFVMAFNVQKSELYIVEDANKEAIAIRPDAFTIMGHHFSKFEKAYYEVVYIGKNTLLKEYNCNFHSNNSGEKTGYEASGQYDGEFVKSSKLLLLKDEQVTQMPKGKNFYALFGDKKTLIEEYVKTNNISLKSENGIVSTLKYYDSLERPQ
ncbi:hypothetical protein Emtol_0857 [Emticicia oligotrophica DSM 17448]|uniref:GLPGLI family protein n=1 Tax=Emticicia oligotrophica (strain DSM 17448 / CIP 109782 / MTCC 6937 / GPTSA100-15) TaxID=929562 RepID=A0ABM5MY02_EMTOG|nr:hypothetical protein [Emticicia oligotrophica]AFK02008.1 hypothetical protein Emtol_0857 [Emticicia oligotrophica DSM 17448]